MSAPARALLVHSRHQSEGLCRLPERCACQGSRARCSRRLWTCGARQTLHDEWHGDGSGQTVQRQRIGLLAEARRISPADVGTTTFRPFYTPVSFGALAGASTGKHFQPVRKSPCMAGRSARRNLRRDGALVPVELVPRAGETTGGTASTGKSECQTKCRPLRRLDAREDRDLRGGCRRVPQPRLLQRLPQAAGRQGPLRPDAAGRWLHL